VETVSICPDILQDEGPAANCEAGDEVLVATIVLQEQMNTTVAASKGWAKERGLFWNDTNMQQS